MFDWLSWFIPSAALVAVGFLWGMSFAEGQGPSYKWRYQNNCHCGEARDD